VGSLSPNYTALYAVRWNCWQRPLWGPQTQQQTMHFPDSPHCVASPGTRVRL
jgi:hypothetical protein